MTTSWAGSTPLLPSDDRAGLVALLRETEAKSAHGLKLEKLWEPTPFPQEEQLV